MPPTTIPGWHGLTSEDKSSVLSPVGINFLLNRQSVGLIDASAKSPRAVRLTLKPLARHDLRPVFPGTPTNGVAFPGLRAGFTSIAPAIPPNPIIVGNRPTGQANYVLVTWGSGGARSHRLVADWPVGGASIELAADFVQVEGICGETPGLAVPAASQDARPRFAAELAESRGLPHEQYDALSFSQLLSGVFATGVAVQAGVPEFARALSVSFADALPNGGIFEISWMDPNGQVVEVGRYGTGGASTNANTVMPVWVSVPLGAVAVVVSGTAFAAVVTAAYAQWRIAP